MSSAVASVFGLHGSIANRQFKAISTRRVVMNVRKLRRDAQSGSVPACTALGLCYLEGVGVAVDYEQAERLLQKAASRGATRAMVGLARMCAEGLGVPKDVGEAIRLYKTAAERGEFSAQIALGRLYSRGVDVPREPDVALRWYAAAAAQEGTVADRESMEEAKRFLAANIK
jgi:TPR repeat protein